MDHIHEKESLNHGIRTIWNEIANQGGEIDGKNYLRDDLEFALFFKSLRIRLLFVDKKGIRTDEVQHLGGGVWLQDMCNQELYMGVSPVLSYRDEPAGEWAV